MFPQRLKELRKSKKISQTDLAKTLSVSQQTIGGWEVGRTEPNTELLQKIASYFNVTVDYLLGNNNTPSWATEKDIADLHDYLSTNKPMNYEGVELDSEAKEAVHQFLIGYYWKRRKQENDANE